MALRDIKYKFLDWYICGDRAAMHEASKFDYFWTVVLEWLLFVDRFCYCRSPVISEWEKSLKQSKYAQDDFVIDL